MQQNPDVAAWLDRYDNPMKPLLAAVRNTVLEADARIGECIKWQAPTFTYRGNIASFFPKARSHVSLMFHKGAHIPGHFASLEGDGADGRVFKVATASDLLAKSAELQAIVRAWCDQQDGRA